MSRADNEEGVDSAPDGRSRQHPTGRVPSGVREAIGSAASELASVPPFSELARVDRAKLAAALDEVIYDQGDVIFAEGEAADALFILREGLIERLAEGVRLSILEPPAVFGDLALLRDEPRATTLVALTPCVVWRLPADRFGRLLRRTPGIGARFAASVSNRLATSQREMAEIAQEFEGLSERLYTSLSRDEQERLQCAALLPRLDPAVVAKVLGQADGAATLPLADLVVRQPADSGSPDSGAAFPPPFRRFLLRRLEQRLGEHGVANERRQVARQARDAGRADLAVQVLVEGGLLGEAAELVDREVERLQRRGRFEDGRRLVALLPDAALQDRPRLHRGAPTAAVDSASVGRAPVAIVQFRWRRPSGAVIGMALGALAVALGWLLPPPAGLTPPGWHALATLIAIVPLLALDALPEGIVALALGAIWVIGGVVPPRVAFGGFASAGWILVVAVLIVGAVIASSGLLYRLSLWAVAHTRGGFVGQVVALSFAGVLLGPANPNATGRVMLIAPATTELVEALGYAPLSRPAVGLSMAVLIGFGQVVGAFLTSSTTAVLVYTVLPEASRSGVTFTSWIVRAAPTNLILFALLIGFIAWAYRPRSGDVAAPTTVRQVDGLALQRALLGPPSRQERIAIFVTLGLLVGFLTQPLHGVDPAWVAVASVVVYAATGVLSMDDFRTINWSFALFYGILPSMADVLSSVGLDKWLAGLVIALVGGLISQPVLFVGALTLLCFAVSFVVRWQAAAPLLTIALAPAAIQAGMDPWVVGLVALIGCNGFFLPYQSTTYLALYHGTGGKLFTHAQARPIAIAFGIATLLALCASVPVWHAMGLA